MKVRGFFSLFFLALLASYAKAAVETVVEGYQEAKICYQSLDKNVPLGWEGCIRQFQDLVNKYPKTREAMNALFSVARLSNEKYNLTREEADLQRAFNFYNEFLRKYPESAMADDALYRIGTLRFEEQKDVIRADKAMRTLLKRYPYGDMVVSASEYLKKLEPYHEDHPVITADSRGTEGVSDEIPFEEPIEEKTLSTGDFNRLPDTKENLKSSSDFTVKTVVIDPGHGGEDPGAVGSKGTRESVIALQVARKLALRLKKDLGLNVYLTRTNNRGLILEKRNKLAEKRNADLFISIHANANPSDKVQGVQTFYLNNATSEAARRLASRENKSPGKASDLSDKILSTMLQNANTDESRDLAHAVQKEVVERLKQSYGKIHDMKVDAALFYVLVGAKCPGILVETSFITNPMEELRLTDSSYQWALAEGISQGVRNYIRDRQKMAVSSSL